MSIKPNNHMESVILKPESFINSFGIDTLALSKLFKESKFTEQQSELLSEVIKISQESKAKEIRDEINNKDLATKQDLLITEKKLELKIEQSKSDLIKWVIGLLLIQAGLIFTLIKVFLPN